MIKLQKMKHITKIALPILKKGGAVRAGIFGSYARGEAKERSDVDILVKLKGRKSLLDVVRLERELKVHLRKKVDLLTYDSIHPYLKKRILNEEVRIL